MLVAAGLANAAATSSRLNAQVERDRSTTTTTTSISSTSKRTARSTAKSDQAHYATLAARTRRCRCQPLVFDKWQ